MMHNYSHSVMPAILFKSVITLLYRNYYTTKLTVLPTLFFLNALLICIYRFRDGRQTAFLSLFIDTALFHYA